MDEEILKIVHSWVQFLREEKLWGNDDPLFPATRVEPGPSLKFQAVGLDRKPWSNATAIRGIFKEAFTKAGLPYFNPHSFRNTLVHLGESKCKTPEEFKAWSENLGHEKVLTTFLSYGEVGTKRKGEIMKALGKPQPTITPELSQLAKALAHELRQPENSG